ncbi:MAG: tRNA (guanosine(46)-N7)-methyltransferase TrmB, partial [Candidatus Bipolaricaulota bacterium]|nr:tRNA (guanosine(46)-N7)-methyltransferase TrmB [Candidatus Bipolaricaulota bacterium]MDW8126907.1 tRNA (guanosine(46)-N7)-methyltransferase TrmB [Candidatus Bipolaricaulota bacterium]
FPFPNKARGRARLLRELHLYLDIDEPAGHPQECTVSLEPMDFVPYLIQPARWEELPPRWEEVFPRPAPLAVEIGFGNGEFLAEMAQKYPDWNWVGFETSLTCIVKTGRKLRLAGVENVRLALLDGKFGLRELFPDQSVSRVYVNFPCPWPKSRHAARRLVDQGFAQTLAAVLAPEGEFHLVTDARWYADEAGEHLRLAGLAVEGPDLLQAQGPGTRYERKWRAHGLSIWRLVAQPIKLGKVKRIAEGAMPHAKVAVSFSREKIAALCGLKETWTEGAFVLKDVFFSATEKAALVRVFSHDAGFSQHFFLSIAEHKGGLIVQLDAASTPFRTPAVKRAVAKAAEVLGTP